MSMHCRPCKYLIYYTLQKHAVMEHRAEIIKLTSVPSTPKRTKISVFVFFPLSFHSRMDVPTFGTILNCSIYEFRSSA